MTPDTEYLKIVMHLSIALLIGGAIGLERSYHGRPAGFRTHALVCISSSALMLVTLYQSSWFPVTEFDTVRVDPTRMAQGIMTGIGFLGAGAILKEGLSVRGLTTAASIWITAAIGILAGVGFYFAAAVATLLTLGTLSVFRWIEMKMPTQLYAHHVIRFARESAMPEAQLRTLIAAHGFTIVNLSYQLCDQGRLFEYSMMIRTFNQNDVGRLSETLCAQPTVLEFRIAPTGD